MHLIYNRIANRNSAAPAMHALPLEQLIASLPQRSRVPRALRTMATCALLLHVISFMLALVLFIRLTTQLLLLTQRHKQRIKPNSSF